MSRRAWLLLAACSAAWGLPYLLIKIAVDDGVPATGVVLARSLLGGLVLVPLVGRRGLRALDGRWRAVFVLAALDMAVPFLLLTVGERAVPSSLASILIASVPLLVALLAMRFDAAERVGGLRLAGLAVGMAGIVLLLGVEVSGSAEMAVGAALIMAAAVSYAAATLYVKRAFAGVPALPLVAGMLVATTAMLSLPAAAQAPAWPAIGAETWAALVALGVVCSAAGYVTFYALIAEVGASRASINTYLSPGIAAVLGVVVLGESLHAGGVAGLLLILAGAWLATGGRPPGLRGSQAAARAAARGDLTSTSTRSARASRSAAASAG